MLLSYLRRVIVFLAWFCTQECCNLDKKTLCLLLEVSYHRCRIFRLPLHFSFESSSYMEETFSMSLFTSSNLRPFFIRIKQLIRDSISKHVIILIMSDLTKNLNRKHLRLMAERLSLNCNAQARTYAICVSSKGKCEILFNLLN